MSATLRHRIDIHVAVEVVLIIKCVGINAKRNFTDALIIILPLTFPEQRHLKCIWVAHKKNMPESSCYITNYTQYTACTSHDRVNVSRCGFFSVAGTTARKQNEHNAVLPLR